MADAPYIAGSIMHDGVVGKFNKSAAAIARGDGVFLDVADDTYKKAPITGTPKGRFAVAVKDAAAADTQVEACYQGHVLMTADGAIAPYNPVTTSTTTAGRVIEGVATDETVLYGWYDGKPNVNTREGGVLTAAAQGEVIIVRLRGP